MSLFVARVINNREVIEVRSKKKEEEEKEEKGERSREGGERRRSETSQAFSTSSPHGRSRCTS